MDCLVSEERLNDYRRAIVNDRPPNFRDGGKFHLVRCFRCDPVRGRENYCMAVPNGVCAWCNWPAPLATCRVCGCTDIDCSRCVEATGDACGWANPECTVCTRCARGGV